MKKKLKQLKEEEDGLHIITEGNLDNTIKRGRGRPTNIAVEIPEQEQNQKNNYRELYKEKYNLDYNDDITWISESILIQKIDYRLRIITPNYEFFY